ncbi:MAG: ribonuclease E/G, partial [Actinobacteria bacterium]|nr:ribonuclease E/G [Actinomycetota bacterium]
IVRDLFAGDFERALIDHDRTYKRIVGYLKKTSPHMLERVHRYKEKEPLFEGTGVDAEIRSTLSRRVDLPSGGYLVFDYAEAFTVIDVNTGRFVGSRSKTSGARLEDTITKNNLEAVKEVVRQLRLRDIGGIIVIDFIDMANPKNRATVEEALRNELERDRTKTYVVEISPLGLVEMTRQNVTDGPREILTKKCPTCEGDGIVVSEATAAMEVERRLRAIAAGSRAQAFQIEVNPRTRALLVGPGAARLRELEEATKKRLFLVAKEGAHADHAAVLAEGKLVDLQPAAPVAEGAELEVKFVELDLHDVQAAVAKHEGLDIVVGGAAKQVGKKAKVRIERVVDGIAYAALLVGGAQAPEPITFESEAEKPTRAPTRTKKVAEDAVDSDAAEREPEAELELEPEPDVAEAAREDEEEDTVETAETDGASPKKKTRRGSRGGRNRKKKPATVSEDGEEQGEQAEPVSEEAPAPEPKKRAPRIHVPRTDLGEKATAEPRAEPQTAPQTEAETAGEAADAQAEELDADELEAGTGEPKPKRKTRRGSRGGRNRKKTTGIAAAGANGDQPDEARSVEAEAAAPETVAPEENGAPEPHPDEYVPMSEWVDEIEA